LSVDLTVEIPYDFGVETKSRGNRNIQLTMNETIADLLGLSPVENKELCARLDGARLSSDGGVL